MARRFFIGFFAIIVAGFILFVSFKTDKKKAGMAKGFAVVELFTSEGCSSCPPADNAVAELAKEYADGVYILAYHVDYWDYIGWKDPFSKALFSQRQRNYASKFHLNSIYTPQVIVNGKTEFVGSRKTQLQSEVKQALNTTTNISLEVMAERKPGDSITISYKAGNSDDEFLQIALVQLKAQTSVKRGENRGKVLDHINIVRELKKIEGGKNLAGTIFFSIPKGLSAKDIEVVAFVQDRKSWRISAATSDTFL